MYSRYLNHWIVTEVAATAVAAKRSSPDGIELLYKRFDKCGVVGENAVFEVALLLRLRAHARAGQIGRAEVRLNAIDDDALEMHPRTKHPLGLLRPLRGSFASLIRPT